jgi:hypothetical protein
VAGIKVERERERGKKKGKQKNVQKFVILAHNC